MDTTLHPHAVQPEGPREGPPDYPFTALVGQPELQRALLLAAVDPQLGGVLVQGPRGTAKSTAARALAALLPSPAPFVTLPLAASLEQLVGTLDLGAALGANALRFQPGLLARADGGVLYVDEVNLLPDPLVDALLDAAASGRHRVERDGISHHHAARFVLVGTMNPEEGELRPQLLDRFGLSVTLANPSGLDERLAILRQRLAFDDDAAAVHARHRGDLDALRGTVARARQRLPGLAWAEPALRRAAELAQAAAADGLRGDLACLRAARAWAALQGAGELDATHVDAVAELALAHRRQSGGEAAGLPPDQGSPPPPPVARQASQENAGPPQVFLTPPGGALGAAQPWGRSSATAVEGDAGVLPPQPVAPIVPPADWWPAPKKVPATAMQGEAVAGDRGRPR
ncbi:MAG: AAA family ATPase [Burkholderiales bacterium]|jgi:magnesium chelatase subunit I|nr:AAA family ATPase [Burkholderiales bacterium]